MMLSVILRYVFGVSVVLLLAANLGWNVMRDRSDEPWIVTGYSVTASDGKGTPWQGSVSYTLGHGRTGTVSFGPIAGEITLQCWYTVEIGKPAPDCVRSFNEAARVGSKGKFGY